MLRAASSIRLTARFRHGQGYSSRRSEYHQPLLQSTPRKGEAPADPVPRPQVHLRYGATLRGCEPEVLAGAPGAREHQAHFGHLLALSAERGGSDRYGDGERARLTSSNKSSPGIAPGHLLVSIFSTRRTRSTHCLPTASLSPAPHYLSVLIRSLNFPLFDDLPTVFEPRTFAPPLTGWNGTASPPDLRDFFELLALDAPPPLYNFAIEHLLIRSSDSVPHRSNVCAAPT